MALKRLAQLNGAEETLTLLKWAMLAYFPRDHVANLAGEKLQQFLLASLPVKHQQTFKQYLHVADVKSVDVKSVDVNNTADDSAVDNNDAPDVQTNQQSSTIAQPAELFTRLYQASNDEQLTQQYYQQIQQATQYWLTHALPPKKTVLAQFNTELRQ